MQVEVARSSGMWAASLSTTTPRTVLSMRRQLLHQRQEHRIDEQPGVLGVVDDEGDLLREQARIDGVADRADAGDAVVELEMAVVVPGERRDAIADADVELDWSAWASCALRRASSR